MRWPWSVCNICHDVGLQTSQVQLQVPLQLPSSLCPQFPWPERDSPWDSVAAEMPDFNFYLLRLLHPKTQYLQISLFSKSDVFLSSYFPPCYAFNCPEPRAARLCSSHSFFLLLSALLSLPALWDISSPGIVQVSVGGIIVWGCLVFLIPFLVLHEDYPWTDCVVTRELRPLWWVILQELMILEPTPQLKGLHYNYHSHTLHPLSIWRNVL